MILLITSVSDFSMHHHSTALLLREIDTIKQWGLFARDRVYSWVGVFDRALITTSGLSGGSVLSGGVSDSATFTISSLNTSPINVVLMGADRRFIICIVPEELKNAVFSLSWTVPIGVFITLLPSLVFF